MSEYISPSEFLRLRDEGLPLIDVRSPSEYASGTHRAATGGQTWPRAAALPELPAWPTGNQPERKEGKKSSAALLARRNAKQGTGLADGNRRFFRLYS